MAPQGPPAPRARHAAPSRHARGGRRSRGRRGGGGRLGLVALVALAVLVVGGGGAALGVMTLGSSSPDTTAPASASGGGTPSPASGVSATPASDAGLPSSPTMIASVSSVDSGDAVTVDVAGRSIPVRILGIDAPAAPQCGAEASLAYAQQQMAGQMVTLVPDPTMPETDAQGRRLAYVVLRSQLSYTDAALMKGMARTDTSQPLWYADVFAREQSQAVDDGVGIWGAPCNARP